RTTSSQAALAAAVQCGEHLIRHARPMEVGLGWGTAAQGKALCGFSHGTAGVAWALLELAALTGQTRFREAALGAIAYERSQFLPEVGNWPDWRADATAASPSVPAVMVAWCHGASGIGLARLLSLADIDGPETRAELNAALQTIL